MKFGLFLPTFDDIISIDQIVSLAVEAEKAGWDGLFLPDHLFYDNKIKFYDPWILLAAMATHTTNIKLATWISPIARRQPWQVARDLATLDRLSKGRVIFGTGLGAPPSDFSKIGMSYNAVEIAKRMDEGLEIVNKLWSGERITYSGKYYQLDDVELYPQPQQKPKIPIMVAGRWPAKKPIARGAEWDGIMPITNRFPDQFTEEELREMIAYYAKSCEKRGKDQGEILLGTMPSKTMSPGEFHDLCIELGVTWLQGSAFPRDGMNVMDMVKKGPRWGIHE